VPCLICFIIIIINDNNNKSTSLGDQVNHNRFPNIRRQAIISFPQKKREGREKVKYFSLVGMGGMRDTHLSVDSIVTLDVAALSGENDAPVGLGLILVSHLGLSVIVVVIILNSPVNIVVRDVGVIDGLLAVRLAVRVGGGNSDEGEENDSDL